VVDGVKASVDAGVGAGVEFPVWGDTAAPDGRQLLLRQVLAVEIRRRGNDDRADGRILRSFGCQDTCGRSRISRFLVRAR